MAHEHMTHKSTGRVVKVLLTIVMLGCILTTLMLLRALAPASVLDIAWSPLMLVALISLLAISWLVMLLNQPSHRSRVTFWFSIYTIAFSASQAGGALAQFSHQLSGYLYWSQIGAVGSIALGPAFLFFTLAYTGVEDRLYRPLMWVSIFMSMMMVYRVQLVDGIVGNYSHSQITQFGFQPSSNGPYYGLLVLWVYLFTFTSFLLLLRYHRTIINARKRRQNKLITISIVVPTIIVLPSILIPALTPFLFQFTGAGILAQIIVIGYAILRYGLFTVDAASLSDTILGTMNESVITTNAQLEVERLNPAAARMLDLKEGAAEGQSLQLIFGKPGLTTIQQSISAADGKSIELDLPASHGSLPISLLSSPITHDDRSIAGYILVFRDISRERNAKREIEQQVVERTRQLNYTQTKLDASIESLSIGFMIVDPDQKVTLRNSAMNQILGLDPATPLTITDVGNKFTELSDAATHNFEKAYLSHQVIAATDITYGSKILRSFMAPVVTKDAAKQFLGTVVLLEDTTEQVVLNRSKDEFFSIASHELRTPLTAIRGNAGMLLDMYPKVLRREGMQDMVEDIHESSLRLIDIVNDFLDTSRIEQGKISFAYEEVALDQVIETTIYEMRAVLQEKHLSLSFNKKTLGELPKVWADKNRLKQIIYNLVGNAAKFTDQGGITINATADGDMVKISVSDTGRGISIDNQRLLFHKFQQAGGSLLTRDTTRGTGLGLYISKMLIENMGGHIALESSTENQGSTFSATIPIATGKKVAKSQLLSTTDTKTGLTHLETVNLAARALTNPATPGTAAKPGRLLIIEDDPYVLRMYARIFNTQVLTVKTALNGNLGLAAADSFHPDLILLDVMMPVMNGIETLDALKGNPATKKIPVIMLSSLGEEDIIHQALDKGAAAYLIKSDFAPEQLQHEIQEHLKAVKRS